MRTAGLLILAFLAGLPAGCRQQPPPPSHNRDLSTDASVPLLPVPPPWVDPALKDGKAEWYAFTPPDDEPESEETEAEEEDAEHPGESPEDVASEIREVIGEYNGLVAEQAEEDLVGFFVDDQQESIKPHISAGLALGEKVAELQRILNEKFPDQEERITAGSQSLSSGAFHSLEVTEITKVSDSESTGRMILYGAPATCRFLLRDDTWYFEVSELPDFADVKPEVQRRADACDAWVGKLQSDEVTAESVLEEIAQQTEPAKSERPTHDEGDEVDTGDE